MKKFLLTTVLALAVALAPVAHAVDLGRVDMDAFNTFLNQGKLGVFSRYSGGTQLVRNTKHAVRCTYDFAVLGGAVSTVSLRSSTQGSGESTSSNCLLPKGALITNAYMDVITTVTSGGSATVAVSSGESAGDLLAALAYTDGKFAGAASHPAAMIPVGTAATAFKLTADRTPTVAIAVAALTAGKFYVIIEYLLSQTL